MTTLDSAAPEATTGAFAVPTPAARPRRQPRWIAAGLLAICLGGLGSAFLYAEATGSREVLQVTRPIGRGETIRVGDLRPISAGSLPSAATVPADRINELVGQRALIDLAGGAVLPADVIGAPAVDRGMTQVGLKLAPGRLPIGDLAVGVSVQLIPVDDPRASSAPQTSSSNAAGPIPAVVVTVPRPGPDGVAALLDVRVSQDRARQLAELAAADRIVLVREG